MKLFFITFIFLVSCVKENSNRIPLDAFNSYEEDEVIVSYYEMNERLRHLPIPTKKFKLIDEKLVESSSENLEFVHLRNIFIDKLAQKIFFYDHGLDSGEFEGAFLKSLVIKDKKVEIENNGLKKFYFNGINFNVNADYYQIFSGPEFFDIRKNGNEAIELKKIFENKKVKKGFLSFGISHSDKFVAIYMGGSEFLNSNNINSKDYLLKFNKNGDVELESVDKKLPKMWATVYVESRDIDGDGVSDFLLSQHDLGFNNYVIGEVLSRNDFKYNEIFKGKRGENTWVSQIYSLDKKIFLLVRGGSSGGRCTTIKLINKEAIDLNKCFLKIMKLKNIDYAIDYDLNLKELNSY